jgi:hypothetical protein
VSNGDPGRGPLATGFLEGRSFRVDLDEWEGAAAKGSSLGRLRDSDSLALQTSRASVRSSFHERFPGRQVFFWWVKSRAESLKAFPHSSHTFEEFMGCLNVFTVLGVSRAATIVRASPSSMVQQSGVSAFNTAQGNHQAPASDSSPQQQGGSCGCG